MGSTVSVPQTRTMNGAELSADDAWETLRKYGGWHLARDSLTRFRYGDGMSHARALAFQLCLAIIPGAIALVGLSAVVVVPQLDRALPGDGRSRRSWKPAEPAAPSPRTPTRDPPRRRSGSPWWARSARP
ncbi:hypothetical protein [Nonomuraea insulae]|uniref:Uncharacterized protein n=1 Tax=Nonomuraea insulae TaxID=1616787 RepID=A0ABW1CK92_9ACTN